MARNGPASTVLAGIPFAAALGAAHEPAERTTLQGGFRRRCPASHALDGSSPGTASSSVARTPTGVVRDDGGRGERRRRRDPEEPRLERRGRPRRRPPQHRADGVAGRAGVLRRPRAVPLPGYRTRAAQLRRRGGALRRRQRPDRADHRRVPGRDRRLRARTAGPLPPLPRHWRVLGRNGLADRPRRRRRDDRNGR